MTTPWKDGFYMAKNDTDKKIHIVKGNDVTVKDMSEFDYPDLPMSDRSKGTWTFGDFGEPSEKLENACHSKLCNVQFSMDGWTEKGIINQEGTEITFIEPDGNVDQFQWKNPEEIQHVLDSREAIDERQHFYKIQPENQGKLIFLTGSPGCGKSSTALKLAQKSGFVFYEGDCFYMLKNPYIPLDVSEPSLAMAKQNHVKGTKKSTLEEIKIAWDFYLTDLPKGNKTNEEKTFPFFRLMAQDILSEKAKIGGDWVVTDAIPTRKIRDVVKKECNATFIVLTVSEEVQKARLEKRHAEDESGMAEWLTSLYKNYEPVQADEENAFEVVITPELQLDDVVEKVLEIIKTI